MADADEQVQLLRTLAEQVLALTQRVEDLEDSVVLLNEALKHNAQQAARDFVVAFNA